MDGYLSKGVVATLSCDPSDVRADGSFEIVVAQRDPGRPNWLDTAGLETGMLFWRPLLPQENVGYIETEVIDLGPHREESPCPGS